MGFSGTSEKWFESRWGYFIRPHTIRVFATIRGSVQRMFNSGVFFAASSRQSRGQQSLLMTSRFPVPTVLPPWSYP
jgi:hypothetical protein